MNTKNLLRSSIVFHGLFISMVCGMFVFAPLQLCAAESGMPEFTTQTFSQSDKTGRAIVAADMNKDGFKDIVLVTGGHGEGGNYVYFNNGSGHFSDDQRMQFGQGLDNTGEAAAVSDLDNDGYPDVVVANSSDKTGSAIESYLYKNNQGKSLDSVGTPFNVGKGGARAVAFTDFDGDGKQDIIFGVSVNDYLSGNTNTILFYQNQGNFNFKSYSLTVPKLNTGKNKFLTSVVLATVDINGALNGSARLKYLIVGNRGKWNEKRLDIMGITTNENLHPSAVFENKSTGTPGLTLKSSFGNIYQTTGIALGDVNSDGHWDIVSGHGGEPNANGGMNYVYLNNGSDGFSDSNKMSVGTEAESSRPVAIGDVDQDAKGKLDIAVGNQGRKGRNDPSYLYYYNNTAINGQYYSQQLATQILSNGTSQLRDLALADMNNDGKLDIVGAVSCVGSPGPCMGAFVMLQIKP
jgi:hypothetical protein